MVLSGGSCTGKLRAACPTAGAVDGLGACVALGKCIQHGITKGAGVKPAPKVLDLFQNPKGVKKSSVYNSSPL